MTTILAEILTTRVDELELSVRADNCLRNANLVYVWQLIQVTEAELRRLPNLGRRTLNEIVHVLGQHGLRLGTEPPAPELFGNLADGYCWTPKLSPEQLAS